MAGVREPHEPQFLIHLGAGEQRRRLNICVVGLVDRLVEGGPGSPDLGFLGEQFLDVGVRGLPVVVGRLFA